MGAKEKTLEQLLRGHGEVEPKMLAWPSFADVTASPYADSVI